MGKDFIIKVVGKGPFSINPSKIKRDWMDKTHNSHAYRCLPMTSVNPHGWTVNLEEECIVEWDGTDQQKSVKVLAGPGEENVAGGFVTFRLPYIFSTPLDYYLWCGGQPNYTKDDALPLSAIIRSDWYPSHFQVTWKLTRPGKIIFEKGMPIMFFMPYPKNLIDSVNIHMYDIDPSIEEQEKHKAYGRYIVKQDRQIRGNKDYSKEWSGLYRKGKYSEKSVELSEDPMWIPRPKNPESKK